MRRFFASLLCCGILITAAGASAATRSPDGHTRLALLVGINEYKNAGGSFENLKGCVNDILQFKTLLTTKYGFPEQNVRVLTDAQATRDGILRVFREHLIAQASAGDKVIFYYAGHGSRAPDPQRPSGFDETIVPSDSRDAAGKVFDITDTVLRELFGELRQKTSEITAILDSCHSGTAIRGNRQRAIVPDSRPQPLPSARGSAPPPSGTGDRGIVFIAGSRSDQSSFEHLADGAEHGAMSYFLARELSRDDGTMTWRDLLDRVRSMVTARYPMQEPQLEGAAADKLVFGERSVASQPYFLTSAAGSRSRVRLDAGQVHGIFVGSQFDVFPSGTKKFDGAVKPIARVEVTDTDNFRSIAKLLSGGPVLEGSRAVERARNFGAFRLRVFLDASLAAKVADPARAMLLTHAQFQLATSPAECDVQIAERGATVVILAADGSTLSPPLSADDTALTAGLERLALGWAKWYQLLVIDNPVAAKTLRVDLTPLRTRENGKLVPGDIVRLTVRNDTGAPVFISVLDLSSDGSISPIPLTQAGASEALESGKEISRDLRMLPLPEGYDQLRDVIKVFGTNTAVDFSPLTSDSIRGDTQALTKHPLGALLAKTAFGTRGVVEAVPLADWSTASKSLVIDRH